MGQAIGGGCVAFCSLPQPTPHPHPNPNPNRNRNRNRNPGGGYFAFIVEDSLELTRVNISSLAEEAADRAYWADESAIAVVQRYLRTRLLIFKPAADPANRCACVGDVGDTTEPSFVVLRHSHRASKEQHYELYALPGRTPAVAVFNDGSLPAGIKRAFASTCPVAGLAWQAATDV